MAPYTPYLADDIYDFLSERALPRIITYPESIRILEQRPKSFESMYHDTHTLAELLKPVYMPADATLAHQIFGSQSRHQHLSLRHIVNLLHERARLHERHLKDIAHDNMKLQESLSGAQLHKSLDNGRQASRVEAMLLQLDNQKREEELAFWKDTAELRNLLFEHGAEYQALRHRIGLLDSLEVPEGPELPELQESHYGGQEHG